MITKEKFENLTTRTRIHKYSSLNYIDYADCENAEILVDDEQLILLIDRSQVPNMLHFATDDFAKVVAKIKEMAGALRLHFVPKEYAEQLKVIGFVEWGEFADFWNNDLAKTVADFTDLPESKFLEVDECETAAAVTKSCALQSRGFEGEEPEFFAEWLADGNKVLVERVAEQIVAVCCVSIYNDGTTVWIREIAVYPDYQGKGFGKKLLKQALKYGAERGAIKAFLSADILNKNAIGLYEQYDFQMRANETELQMVRI